MDGSPSEEIYLDDEIYSESDYRPHFSEDLEKLRNRRSPDSKARPCTVEIVYHMNRQMAKNQVKMSKLHYKAAKESIERGDDIVEYTIAENQHVLQSTGKGFFYRLGFGYHKFLNSTLNPPTLSKDGWVPSKDPISGD